MRQLFLLIVLASSSVVFAQDYDIRLNRTSTDCGTGQVCYDVQLRPVGGEPFNLAGQNYRLFWDATKGTFLSGTSTLPSQYTAYTQVQLVENVDASAVNGSLSYEPTLSFLNYFMDLNDTQNGGIVLVANEWNTTSNLCFTMTQEVMNNPTECFEADWANSAETAPYATAFVEVSRWVSTNNTTNSVGIDFQDLDASSGDQACFDTACGCAAQAPTISGN